MDKKEDGFVELFDDDAIVTLTDENNQPTDFYEIASIEYNDKFYEILLPVEPMDDLEDGEALIFEYDIDEENDEKKFKLIFDEKIAEAVFDMYLKAEADFESEHGDDDDSDGSCGGGCGGCGGGCHH